MKAMVLTEMCSMQENKKPLKLVMLPEPIPREKEILVKVSACCVCHTELDEIEGRTPPPQLPVIPGHQVIGRVVKTGARAAAFKAGDRVGIAWIHSSCGICSQCR
jgi:propanol-preferring alcohol dehydrogenase